jgi:TolA-binding protein
VVSGRVAVNYNDRHGAKKRLVISAGQAVIVTNDSVGHSLYPRKALEQLSNDIDSLYMPMKSDTERIAEFGSIIVHSAPLSARVMVEGEVVGYSPCAFLHRQGDFRIVIDNDGYVPFDTILTIESGKATSMSVNLRKRESEVWGEETREERAGDGEEHEAMADSGGGTGSGAQAERSLVLIEIKEKIDNRNYSGACMGVEAVLADTNSTGYEVAEALNYGVLCQRALGNHRRVAEYLKKYMQLPVSDHSREMAHFTLITTLYNALSRHEEAIPYMKQYMHRYPDGSFIQEIYLMVAEIYYYSNETDSAVGMYQRFVERFGDSPQADKALYRLGTIYYSRKKNYARANGMYTRLVRGFPSSIYYEDALFWRATCLYRQGRVSEAYGEYVRYIDGYPDGRWAEETRQRLRNVRTVVEK